jgi:hypothetical protein
MNENIYHDILFDLLVDNLKSKDELATVLNFLDNVKTLTQHLYWAKQFKQDMEEARKFLGHLSSE